jgi:hypothetical protein
MAGLLATLDHPHQRPAVLAALPPVHRESLFHLLKLCKAVAANADRNKMNAHNIGIVFGPTTMREPDGAVSLSQAPADVFSEMIEQLDQLLPFFSDVAEFPLNCCLPFSLEVGLEDLALPPCPGLDGAPAAALGFVSPPAFSEAMADVLPTFSEHDMVISWFSVGEIAQISLSIYLGADPDTATFLGSLASAIPNTGSYALPPSLPLKCPYDTPLLLLIENPAVRAIQAVSSPFILRRSSLPLPLLFAGLSSGRSELIQTSFAALSDHPPAELLEFITTQPHAVLEALQALATSFSPAC